MRHYLIAVSVVFCAALQTAAQNILGNDTAAANRLNEYAAKIQFSDPIKAIGTIESSIAICTKINYSYGLSVAYSLRAGLLFYEMKLDSSKLLLDKAYVAIINKKDKVSTTQAATILNRYAAIFQRRQNYDSAVGYYLKAMNIFTENGEELKIINSYYNLSGIYKYLNDTAKMFFYAGETNRLAVKAKDTGLIIRGLITLADAYNFIKNYDSTFLISKKGLALAKPQGITFAIGIFNNFTGQYFANKALQYDSAIYYYNAALASFEAINTQYDIALVLQNLGQVYLKKKDYSNALKFSKQAAALAQEYNFDDVRTVSFLNLVYAEEQVGNITESFRYLKKYTALNDSVQNRNSQKKVFELETKYQAQKKEVELQAQQKIIAQKNSLNYLLAGSTLLLLITLSLLYLNYRDKQKLQQQRIADLETQQQLTATEAVLKGEEQERTRLAKDLHDGLGGMLSGIKYAMGTMKGNLVMTPENGQAFERSMDMLDSSIKEMRRVAHNMMPEALVKFGLDTAMRDFCNDINKSGALKINYQSIGMDGAAVPQTTAITIYRIVQELINNTMKHAAAQTAIVQLTKLNNLLSVTVEDDGKGFEKTILQQSKGIGWANIQSRVEFLKGTIDILSSEGNGTSVHIEINT
jgi:signal transduction histidine kinase